MRSLTGLFLLLASASACGNVVTGASSDAEAPPPRDARPAIPDRAPIPDRVEPRDAQPANQCEGMPVYSTEGYAASTVLTTKENIRAITTDGTTVYWTGCDRAHAVVGKVGVGGGSPTTLISLPARDGVNCTIDGAALGIAFDSTSVYWLRGDRELDSVPLSGGTPTTLASWRSASARSIAIDSGYVYFGYSVITGNLGVVAKVPLGGGAVTTLASWSTTPAVPDGPGAIALGGGDLYWMYHSAPGPGWIVERLAPGGTPTAIYTADSPSSLAADESGVYFSDTETIRKVPIGGGPVVSLSAGPVDGTIILDDGYAYFVTSVAVDPRAQFPEYYYVLFSVPLAGGSAKRLATLCPKFVDGILLAVDATSIYFAFDGKIMKLPKK
jgi:hypothetical protein